MKHKLLAIALFFCIRPLAATEPNSLGNGTLMALSTDHTVAGAHLVSGPIAGSLAPFNFNGQVLYNRSLEGSGIIYRLTWDQNPNPLIESYILLRNGALLATFDASFTQYIFDDGGRTGEQDTYTLFSLTSNNIPSLPLTMELP